MTLLGSTFVPRGYYLQQFTTSCFFSMNWIVAPSTFQRWADWTRPEYVQINHKFLMSCFVRLQLIFYWNILKYVLRQPIFYLCLHILYECSSIRWPFLTSCPQKCWYLYPVYLSPALFVRSCTSRVILAVSGSSAQDRGSSSKEKVSDTHIYSISD
jgi:hypothetical protein